MARVSKRQLDKRVLEKLFDLFFEIIGKQKNKQEFLNVIGDLLSPTERVMIAKRVAIIYLLLKKKDVRTIGQVLKVSKSTVSKFSILLSNSRGVVPLFKKIVRNDKIIVFLNEVFDLLFPPGTYGTSWKAGWERRKMIRREKSSGI